MEKDPQTRDARHRWPAAVVLLAVAAALTAVPRPGTAAARETREARAPAARPGPGRATAPQHDSAALDAARGLLPDRFLEYETSRFVVLSDADPRWTREQSQRLERTHHQFLRYARRLGLDPDPLAQKLVCVLFDDRDEYQAFAIRHDGVVDPWIAGYFNPTTDRIVFYRGDSNPSVVNARARLDEMAADLVAIRRDAREAEHVGAATHARELQRYRQDFERHVRSERRRVDAFAEQISTATVVHEAVHQLMFRTGLQSSQRQYPIWISEGLATAFETDDTRAAFGPDHDYTPRREAFDELLRSDRLLDLRELIGWDEVPEDDDDHVHRVYHQSYALVCWMSRFKRKELRRYLELLLAEPPETVSPGRHVELFEEAFGSVEALERRWLRDERRQWAGS
ncbi:MAG: DUF1570 domain-containing protein [Planctomycetes bacterium]|nr:DUF1570 domain-containing protein [Planctomycetota bacterium]